MNLDPQTSSGARNRTLLKVVVGLAAAGVVIGLLGGLLGASALRAIGFEPGPTQPDNPAPTSTSASPEPTEEETEPSPTPSQPTEDDKDKKKAKLNASPGQVAAGERIHLTGSFPKLSEGVVLQVQRREKNSSWEDFPVEARTNEDGTFETWVVTSRTGKQKWRLTAQQGDHKTPPATVRIG